MGKTPKKAAPGGDERNLYGRRPKATTAPSIASENAERRREPENLYRRKLDTVYKRIPESQGKGIKKKVCAPGKFGANPTKSTGKQAGISKEEKSQLSERKSVDKETKMQTESEESEVKLNVSIQKETDKEPVDKESTSNNDTENTVEHVEHVPSESTSQEEPLSNVPENNKEVIVVEEHTEVRESLVVIQNACNESKESVESEENEIRLSFDMEESTTKVLEEVSKEKEVRNETKEEAQTTHTETKEKEELQSESQTDTESYSVDIVESTTSEVSETSEHVQQSETTKEKKPEQPSKETSSVSYDSSILLKDVQIKLNDCLKENSKLLNATQEDHSNTPSQLSKDQSFGMTLRNISGRNSINRMRYVTTRDQRLSPNNSLFVNTSSVSLSQDEPSTDFKTSRYSASLSDTFPTNGSPMDRKRKLDPESWSSAKKQKTGESENSFLNTSISLLKGFRKPVQVSTPNVTPYKFESKNKLLTGQDDSKIMNDSMETTRKWCVIM